MARKQPNMGLVFLGAIFLIVSIYILVTQTNFTSQMFGGGILLVLAIITFYGAFTKKK